LFIRSLRLCESLAPLLLVAFSCDLAFCGEPQQFEITVSKNVMIAMRDGVRLAADVYRPSGNGVPVEDRFPVLLERTPYNKDGGGLNAEYFVPRGYVVVVQDVRGRYHSEGHWRAMRDDPKDGFDTAKWIGEQPWSAGSIGTMGASYGGATQHSMAIAGAPNLKTMIPIDRCPTSVVMAFATTVPSNCAS
jgi:predicted acyl esterase